MKWLSAIVEFVKGLGLISRLALWLFKRKERNAPQQALDQARTDAATGNDDALNADLDAARDRMRDHKSGSDK